MNKILIFPMCVFSVFVSTAALPFTFYVEPGNEIQDTIDLAIDGDVIIVRDGTYTGDGNRDIDFRGKAITLRSENGPKMTIIDCEGTEEDTHLGFYFESGEETDSVVEGLTITNGSGQHPHYGGGINCLLSSPTIANCIIIGNSSTYLGGGICLEQKSSPTIINCTITANLAACGGGISCRHHSNPTIINCTITDNLGLGILCFRSNPTITNSILWNNHPEEIYVDDATPTLDFCDVRGGWSGVGGNNISDDPLLTPDSHLQAGSPCVDAGQSLGALTYDIDGEIRPFPLGGLFDMGADEFKDSDGDGLPDWWESLHYNDAEGDPDNDGLTNLGEYENGVSPDDPDSDDDGQNDGDEVAGGRNPLCPDNPEKIYYVNSLTGDDSYDGLAVSWDGTHGPKATIQAGIDCTISGWDYIVQVADGIYTGPGNRDLSFEGKAITVRSENGAPTCIIDCEDSGRGFSFLLKEASDSVVDGFTITRSYGYGINCQYSSPTIINCIINHNSSEGIFCRDGSPTITNCTMQYNSNNGIKLISNCKPKIVNCTISDNVNYGISCKYESNPIISNCIINDNSSGIYCSRSNPTINTCTITHNLRNSGIYCKNESNPIISNCIIWANNSYEVYTDDSSLPNINYCDIQGGWSGAGSDNIDEDPLLRPDGHLLPGSPCIDLCPVGSAEDFEVETCPFVPGWFSDI